ncbi:MAG: hypothetical protein ACTSWR_10300 [Candidatus Helarchaeota archaeon]
MNKIDKNGLDITKEEVIDNQINSFSKKIMTNLTKAQLDELIKKLMDIFKISE